MWHIGQRVVCVDDDGYTGEQGVVDPIKGNVYTIRDIEMVGDHLGIRLQEIVNPPHQYIQGFDEKCYHDARFKPLDEKRIDIFRAMLKNKEKEKVE